MKDGHYCDECAPIDSDVWENISAADEEVCCKCGAKIATRRLK